MQSRVDTLDLCLCFRRLGRSLKPSRPRRSPSRDGSTPRKASLATLGADDVGGLARGARATPNGERRGLPDGANKNQPDTASALTNGRSRLRQPSGVNYAVRQSAVYDRLFVRWHEQLRPLPGSIAFRRLEQFLLESHSRRSSPTSRL